MNRDPAAQTRLAIGCDDRIAIHNADGDVACVKNIGSVPISCCSCYVLYEFVENRLMRSEE
ncbi:MAG: hypothetical protein KDG54_14055, partial [Geminicoccaceae bacterium]|nr:hypothetical protein [Geminicoccaceae bacterium]